MLNDVDLRAPESMVMRVYGSLQAGAGTALSCVGIAPFVTSLYLITYLTSYFEFHSATNYAI